MLATDTHIFSNFKKHVSLTCSQKQFVASRLQEKIVPKKSLLLSQGQYCRKIYFIEEGSLRAYNTNEEGKESTIMFAIKDWWITDLECFVNQIPSNLTIIALEDSKIVELTLANLETIYAEIPLMERFFRILFQNAYIREQRRAYNNISMSTEERYIRFINRYPSIVEKITQKQIASYLGVTPEFLSAIKKK